MRFNPLAETTWTVDTRVKSAVLKPPRAAAAPAVGST
jgi:hypothetical protein